MSQYVHLVFSDPPAGVSDHEYNAWYDDHVQEILAVPGFESVRRYAISPVVGSEGSGGFRFLAMYELSCEPAEAIAALESHGLGSADSYIELKDDTASNDANQLDAGAGGPLPLPDWFAGVRFGSWNCTATGDTITLRP
ncbi:MAG TPA: hypothetical protein VFV63_12865 [Ilumatobacteraceae bacterium]|nr:hypothetical protein [Ilumatobacteraceae bacterium]